MILLSGFHRDALGQCSENVYKSASRNVPNEPNFWFTENVTRIVNENDQHVIVIDTSYLQLDKSNPLYLSNKNFGTYLIDSSGFRNRFIINQSTKQTFSLGLGIEHYSIDLKNCYIRFFETPDREWNVVVFDYNQSVSTSYNLVARNPIGYNDTCIFMAPADFKFNRKKYRKGTIISLNEKGIRIIKPVFKKWKWFDSNNMFYSSEFTVNRSFLYSVERDCNTEYHYKVRINYHNAHVDSFEIVQDNFSKPWIRVIGDTLIYHSHKHMYRKYYKTTFLREWKYSTWVDTFPVLKSNWSSFYNNGDLLLIKVTCSSQNRLRLQEDQTKTLNNIPLKRESTVYSLVLAFDLKRNEFLGYPKIEFWSSKESEQQKK